ncbi:MAG: AAA family ATPase [Oceanicaulis sp.]
MSAADLDPALLAFLSDPASHDGQPVETIETHGARVFLAGERALKLKKPVSLGYLDFSTVEKRRAALEAELEINRPNAPQIYDRLGWITKSGGALALDGAGARIEPVLIMRRFASDALYSAIADAGALDIGEARNLARAVRESHARAPAHAAPDGFRRACDVLGLASKRLAGAGADSRRVAAVHQTIVARFTRLKTLLDARAASGFVRRCHGDLHLSNIVRIDGCPVLFDALEFDEDLATIDMVYDLAFLLADLARRGLRAEAQTVLSQYLAGEDTDVGAAGAALADPFSALRCLVRALTLRHRGGADDESASDAWLDTAEDFAAPRPARLIAVGGLSGTGKSTVADGLGLTLGGPAGLWVIKSDVERKASLRLNWSDRIPPEAYTREASETVYTRQRAKAKAALKAGASVILDAVHSRPEEREAAERIAAEAAVPFAGIWLDADRDTLLARVAARTGDPSDADVAVVGKQAAYDPGPVGWARIDASGPRDAVLKRALAAIA